MLRWTLLATLPCLLGFGHAAAFDVSRYRPGQLSDVVGKYPIATGVSLVRDIPIRAKVVYTGDFRDLTEDSHRLISVWSQVMNVPIKDAFKREAKFREAGIEYWLPVQQVLAPMMAGELHPGEEIEVFVVYVGQVDGRHVFLVNAFDHKGAHHPPR